MLLVLLPLDTDSFSLATQTLALVVHVTNHRSYVDDSYFTSQDFSLFLFSKDSQFIKS